MSAVPKPDPRLRSERIVLDVMRLIERGQHHHHNGGVE